MHAAPELWLKSFTNEPLMKAKRDVCQGTLCTRLTSANT